MMGSRAKRARAGVPQPAPKTTTQTSPEVNPPVPKLAQLDVAFGDIRHLPPYATIPNEFMHNGNPYCKFVSDWFFAGRTKENMSRLTARPGVERGAAITAIQAILASWAPKHEHKEAGAAYLLSQWFELRT